MLSPVTDTAMCFPIPKLSRQLVFRYGNAKSRSGGTSAGWSTVEFLSVRCRSCFEPLHEANPCAHRSHYLETESYVISQGIRVEHPTREDFAWKAGDSFKDGHTRYIRISAFAYQLYGWDVMTSVLIHEFGHCELFNEGIEGGPPEVEKLADRRGFERIPSALLPEEFWRHREFFFKSYVVGGWTEEQACSEWREFSKSHPDHRATGE